MKKKYTLNTPLVTTLGCLAVASLANAADQFWTGTGNWGDSSWGAVTGGSYTDAWSDYNNAIFEGTPGAVTATGTVNVHNIDFTSAGGGYSIDGGTLNFDAGSVISNSNNTHNHTITSAITGSPLVNIFDGPAGNGYEGIFFAPSSGTQTLGAVLNPDNTGTRDKSGIYLSGSTAGNTVTSIAYGGGDRYGTVYKQGTSTWTTGDITTGTIRVSQGTLVINGTATSMYSGHVYTGGTVSGNATLRNNDRRTELKVSSGTMLAPGNSIGTMTVDWGGSGGNPTGDRTNRSLQMLDGSIYEWELGAGNTTDTIDVDGTLSALYVDDMVLKITDAGGTPEASDQLAVFTYDVGATVDISGFTGTFDTTGATNYDASGASLVDGGAGIVYLTGLTAIPEPSSTALLGLGGLALILRHRK